MKPILLILCCMALMLSSVSILIPRSHAQGDSVSKAAATAAPAAGEADDGDHGTELLEHWDNAPYSQEARLQIAGTGVFFVIVGAFAFRRRQQLRRLYGQH